LSPTVKWALIAFLALVAVAYFAILIWKAESFARALMGRGYEQRGWDEGRLAGRLRLLGLAGLVLALVSLAVASFRVVG